MAERKQLIKSVKGSCVVRPYFYDTMGNKGVKLSLYEVKLLEEPAPLDIPESFL
jgi:hypothetical protein